MFVCVYHVTMCYLEELLHSLGSDGGLGSTNLPELPKVEMSSSPDPSDCPAFNNKLISQQLTT